ncbi:MAG: branched-chain amino acid ABC transporter permease [Alphaproteobacteria bacterium]|nr:branched-chain amino acid ABC transporter permease [Alphaproteobacteria bacterium]
MTSGSAVAMGLRKYWPLIGLTLLLVLIVAIAALTGSTQLQRTVAEGLIKLIIVIGLYIFIGNSGVLSFGSITYMMIGAYGTAWFTMMPNFKKLSLPGLPEFVIEMQVDPMVGMALAAGLAAVVALVTGAMVMRMNGIAASIATFAVLAMFYTIYNNWERVTYGMSSIIGLKMYVNMYVCLGYALVALLLAFLYQISRFGLALRAAREDEIAARAFGVNVYAQRIIAFTLSGFLIGAAGVLHGHFLGILTVAAFYIPITFITLAMLVIGGQNSLSGAVIGAIVITTVIEVFRILEKGVEIGGAMIQAPLGIQEILLGIVMLLILVFRPTGIMRGREIPWPFGARAAAADVPAR